MKKPIKIIDLFAGPGGLGEGFSAFKSSSGDQPFRIALSIEKEESAHKTLTLRAFYRQFLPGETPPEYYEYLAGVLGRFPEDELYKIDRLRKQAGNAIGEAQNLTLGKNNRTINSRIDSALGNRPGPWVLIGGPPCQAYSLVGRSRNKGIDNYRPEKDHRNYLYKEYLKVIAKFRPPVFVMENVKGMLSAKVDGTHIFPKIMSDLRCPKKALNNRSGYEKTEYEIFSLASSAQANLLSGHDLLPKDYIIRAESFGIPQARHRVILLGIRSDMVSKWSAHLTLPESVAATSVRDVISDLPKLRSGLSGRMQELTDTREHWISAICDPADKVVRNIRQHGLPDTADCIQDAFDKIRGSKLERGSNWDTGKKGRFPKNLSEELQRWYEGQDSKMVVVNHETRSHIVGDLHRYMFSACYAASADTVSAMSPKTYDFPDSLTSDHDNWESGHFSDRFRTQIAGRAATTITSHISKDGHYYIHFDPVQCRSLTVREAARIQTFPDNYFFVGNRTQQYVQVGNAVPPYLANQIAKIVLDLLE